jgi:hypothetical protein
MKLAMMLVLAIVGTPDRQRAVRPEVPVMLVADDLDPCGLGVVKGLKAGGDGFLSVRARPSAKGRELDRLRNGDEVYICADKGDWIGIVYSRPRRDCGVTSAVARRSAYAGPCNSGWVHRNWVELVAG